MWVFRWLRSVARIVLGVLLVAPVVALPLAVLFDRGPAGEPRISPHFFPLVLWLYDDFAWTCSRNSVIFAVVVSSISFSVGSALGWGVARRRFWGRGFWRWLIVAMPAMSPAFLALGLLGLLGSPRPLPWPFAEDAAGTTIAVSLESWRDVPLWFFWIWTTLPWGVAIVTLVTANAVEQLEPSWEDAARLIGIGPFRAWKALTWPLVRPAAARAAALVFLFALVEPGAPLVLGLRRTLAFQIVEIARRSDPFPTAAVWAMVTGIIALVGWLLWRWAGGVTVLPTHRGATGRSHGKRLPPKSSPGRALLLSVILAGWALFGWLPIAGLLRLAIGCTRLEPFSTAGAFQAVVMQARRLSFPPLPGLLVNSLILGIELMFVLAAVAWLIGPTPTGGPADGARKRVGRLHNYMQPLVLGVGLMALSWLLGMATTFLVDRHGWPSAVSAMGSLATAFDPWRNSRITLPFCVALAVVPRFFQLWQRDAATASSSQSSNSALDAALLVGASRARGGRLSQPLERGRWLAGGLVVGTLAATNLTPAIFFQPWSDERTIAPAIVFLAAGPELARSQAAALALVAVAANLMALAVARLARAIPHRPDLD